MLYVDSSVIVKLYVKETLSREVASWIRSNNEAIPLTLFHDLELQETHHMIPIACSASFMLVAAP